MDRQRVLDRILLSTQNAIENATFAPVINEVVLDFLSKQRGSDSVTPVTKRRKKINITPGNSVTVEDLLMQNNKNAQNKTPRTKKGKASNEQTGNKKPPTNQNDDLKAREVNNLDVALPNFGKMLIDTKNR
ncbi:hypothetical protein QE152_g39089 [Popillia japonica]|uniref:Uncharacterized protein n=1 Tax=Popillia japonica TaxID=7064 RepID=A0AAW1HUZ5_POPJA